MAENAALDLGLIKVEAESTGAFLGHAGRVFPDSRSALIDRATNELAKLWLDKCSVGDPTFQKIIDYIGNCPDVFEAAVKLVRFKDAN